MGGDRSDQRSDDILAGLLDTSNHWLLHVVGLVPASCYSLREALVETHRLSDDGLVVQRISLSAGEPSIVIDPDQIMRLWGIVGATPG